MPRIDDHIQKAMGEGKFDNLPGKGKPLRLDDNPLADPEWRLANHMLQTSGYTLPWIALRQEIEDDLEGARAELQRAWGWRAEALAQNQPGKPAAAKRQAAAEELVEGEWQRARMAFSEKIEKINQQIADYNLQIPSEKFSVLLCNIEREIQAITKIN